MKKDGERKLPAALLIDVYQFLCAFHNFTAPIGLRRIVVSGSTVVNTLRGLPKRFRPLTGRISVFRIFQINDDSGQITAVIPCHTLTS